MAVRIRLRRGGKKQQPFYNIVAMEHTNQRNGKILEVIGQYCPQKAIKYNLNEERIKYWLSVGAKPTEPMQIILAKVGLAKTIKKVCKDHGVSKKEKKAKAEQKAS